MPYLSMEKVIRFVLGITKNTIHKTEDSDSGSENEIYGIKNLNLSGAGND